MAVGFRPSTAEILWTEPISGAPADQIKEKGSGMFTAEAVSGSVFYSFSQQMENKHTLVARNAETGALLWEETLPPSPSMLAESIRVMGDHLILEASSNVYVFEIKTGKITGKLGG
jgi:outer membrane protein assembly factor BamB